ncbi:MAG: GTP 3',8-cyclase MoaA [Xanthomonadales bacterium]|nr:GTP 3',8-cyclase [Xanthomonadales bacterium]MCC6593112.1 GTP 3',8-cyclase MoaA [Xanthomonadales bacterium]MCE7930280.1 GTP 3',8-cyclase MoaA [Xanthomonadales bacterium PRO6]
MEQPVSVLPATEVLVDRLQRPLHDLRISVIDRCNFRCPYCMPEDRYPRDHAFLAAAERLTAAEIARIAGVFVELGVGKLRLTGGEPLLRRDLPEIVALLAALPGAPDLALTSNGVLLARDAAALAQAGLKRITVSLDALDPQIFATLSGNRGHVEDVLRGIDAAERAGLAPIKINCVVQRGVNESQVLPLVEHFRGSGAVLRFIEYMDVGTCNRWQMAAVVPSRELHAAIHARWPLVAVQSAYRGEVAERYRFADGGGEIGFISSVSQPFCGDCTRARLSADGRLYTCLFGRSGRDLRTPLRAGASDAELRTLIATIWRARRDRYSEERQPESPAREGRVEMYRIGG